MKFFSVPIQVQIFSGYVNVMTIEILICRAHMSIAPPALHALSPLKLRLICSHSKSLLA
jgi:hypothetical protein